MSDPAMAADDVQATIDREADLVASAMRLVASGITSRTVVAGLLRTEAAVAAAARRSPLLDVVVEPLRRPDAQGFDVVVRRAEARRVTAAAPRRTRRRRAPRRTGNARRSMSTLSGSPVRA